jgi:membrane protein YqaA with SNARE-associated domain
MRWIVHLGGLGLFCVSFLDGFVIPLPIPGSTDFLLLLLVVRHGNPWLLTGITLVASVLGGYITWRMGKASGEAILGRYVPRRIMGPVERWVKTKAFLAVMIAAMLPPPVPLTPFTLASGALGVERDKFLLAYAIGRAVRYSVVAWLGVVYGRSILHMWRLSLADYAGEIGWGIAAISVAGVAYGVFKFMRIRRELRGAPQPQTA